MAIIIYHLKLRVKCGVKQRVKCVVKLRENVD